MDNDFKNMGMDKFSPEVDDLTVSLWVETAIFILVVALAFILPIAIL